MTDCYCSVGCADVQSIKCPNCGTVVMRIKDGKAVLKDRITFVGRGKSQAKCKQCKTLVDIPVKLS